MAASASKTTALLRFLRDLGTLRRKRKRQYDARDRLLWLDDLPRELPPALAGACTSPFLEEPPVETCDAWIEVRKKRKPTLEPLPRVLRDWVPQDLQNDPERFLGEAPEDLLTRLNPEITVREPLPGNPGTSIAVTRRLRDHPEVEEAWLAYVERHWVPWARDMRAWQQIHRIYEAIDSMRRRIEEAEERYELRLAVGLLEWREPSGTTIRRHLLTAPAEIGLDAERGVLTVAPSEDCDGFAVELDMLDLKDQPRLDGTGLDECLEDLDIRAWDRTRVGRVLRVIANAGKAASDVEEDAWRSAEAADETFRVLYAPALVLRERRPIAYEELIARLQATQEKADSRTTPPWDHFIREGAPFPVSDGDPRPSEGSLPRDGGRLFFPLPTNDEQRGIIDLLQRRPYVLVKGPPGTGKSHTIANLICHLLALGERVLVTAYAPKALTVLLDLLPADIRTLCVAALGSSREDNRLLKENVSTIHERADRWRTEASSQREREIEKSLREDEERLAVVERWLREHREAETRPHEPSTGYRGRAAQIARRVADDHARYGWFPELPDGAGECPLASEDIAFLADVHGKLNAETRNELARELGELPLPDPDEFAVLARQADESEEAARKAADGVSAERVKALEDRTDEQLRACDEFLAHLEEEQTRAEAALGPLAERVARDLLLGNDDRWAALVRRSDEMLAAAERALRRVDSSRVELPSDANRDRLLADAERRLEHFRAGGRRGWGLLAPRVVRETRHVEQSCRVDGVPPRTPEALERLIGFLELTGIVQRLKSMWSVHQERTFPDDPRASVDDFGHVGLALGTLLAVSRNGGRDARDIIPLVERESCSTRAGRDAWRRAIAAVLAARRARRAQEPIADLAGKLGEFSALRAHPCLVELARAAASRDPARWRPAWQKRQELLQSRSRVERYKELLETIRGACPALAQLVEGTEGDRDWTPRLRELVPAWNWALARAWVRKIGDPEIYRRLERDRARLQRIVAKRLEELTLLKAWRRFLERLDERTEQNLVAWAKAISRIGKGTGKYAHRHRKAAREYLKKCLPKMPAWIMPMHKLWETTEAEPSVFDTVIVDEASQAGLDALALMLLGKRIIVVGDDKQNSPEAVGVREDDIERLVRDHLQEFDFRNEFRPDSSLYDHAERSFRNPISLREHFRCVPEIIRFSNEHCYRDTPLIPLRQPPPNRLSPLRHVFIEGGACEGSGSMIINRCEAEQVVRAVQECLADPAYAGKTMGVIALQGRAQAELIDAKIAEILDPKEREQRRLRCGVPATFQGDQRDVIFLSLVVAPNHRFRALTGLPDERRFNVAMSRARDQVWLFHSVQLHDMSQDDWRRKLLVFFHNPDSPVQQQIYADREELERHARETDRERGTQPEPYESWFEVDVALELLRRNYRVRPQVPVAEYRIDLVVEGTDRRLAVECDGDTWHGPENFERDMHRQSQLERAGWRFVRIRASEFYVDRESALKRIVQACEELGIHPVGWEPPPSPGAPPSRNGAAGSWAEPGTEVNSFGVEDVDDRARSGSRTGTASVDSAPGGDSRADEPVSGSVAAGAGDAKNVKRGRAGSRRRFEGGDASGNSDAAARLQRLREREAHAALSLTGETPARSSREPPREIPSDIYDPVKVLRSWRGADEEEVTGRTDVDTSDGDSGGGIGADRAEQKEEFAGSREDRDSGGASGGSSETCPDPRNASAREVTAALQGIIEREGPLTKRRLIRCYVEGCPSLQRAGRRVRQRLTSVLRGMQRSGSVKIEDELGDRSPESLVVRLAGVPQVLERPAGDRDLLEIPPSELFVVLDRLHREDPVAGGDDERLCRELLHHYGFSRLTKVRQAHLMRIVRTWRRRRSSSE